MQVGTTLDSEGLMLAGFSLPLHHVATPFMAESLGLREALWWLLSLQCQAVEIEIDAKQLVNAIHDSQMSSDIGLIVDDCKTMLS